MRRRSELGSIASGMLHSFVSRNNDLDGYWGIGVLYLYAQQVGDLTVSIDVLRAEIAPPASLLPRDNRQPKFEALIDRYSSMLKQLMEKRGVPIDWISGVIFSIEFEAQEAEPTSVRIGERSAPFICRLTLTDDHGNIRVCRVDGWCWPHDPRRETRSTRA